MKLAQDFVNFEGALYACRREMGVFVSESAHMERDYSELRRKHGGKTVRNANLMEVRSRQSVVLYQEVARELAGCVLAQEQMSVLQGSAEIC